MIDPISALGIGAWNQVSALDASAVRQQRQAQAFKAMDTDGDGSVSKDEFTTWLEQAQSRMPQTGDAANMPSAGDLFSQLDVNGDGVLSPDELSGMYQKIRALKETQLFQAMDANGDGSISKDEFANWLATAQPQTAATDSQAPASTDGVFSQLTQSIGTTVNGLLDVLKQGAQSQLPQGGTQVAAGSGGTTSIEDLLASYLYVSAALKQYGETEPGSVLNVAA
jgi:Ca2+-binding EF-hand superfamily protein